MIKYLIIMASVLMLSACTTANPRVNSDNIARPSAGTRVLVVRPSVKLSMLTVAGVKEAKGDWSRDVPR